MLSVALRLFIRLRIQKQFSADDGFLIVAIGCLTCGQVIMYCLTIDKTYLVEALTFGFQGVAIPQDFLQQANAFHKWVTIALMLAWCAIMSIKFSFLFLFRRLIDRIQSLVIYWWAVMTFNVIVLGYGLSVYYVACPYYNDPRLGACFYKTVVSEIH